MGKYDISQVMFMFFLFCNIGWVQESIIESAYNKRLINRGFLKGPYIPIYGFGGLTMLIMCLPFEDNGFVVYLVGMISCTILEYFVGWLLEAMFHKQFWDYSMMRFTYKNRISLLSSLFWGLLSLFMVYVLYGMVDALVCWCNRYFIVIYDGIMLTAVCIDTILSVSHQVSFMERLKKLPYEKAKRLMTDKFIQVGGAVMKRKQRINELIEKMKFSVDESDIEDMSSDSREFSEDDFSEEKPNEG